MSRARVGRAEQVEEKLSRMWREASPIAREEIAALPMPLLVMQGDKDCVEIAHAGLGGRRLPRIGPVRRLIS